VLLGHSVFLFCLFRGSRFPFALPFSKQGIVFFFYRPQPPPPPTHSVTLGFWFGSCCGVAPSPSSLLFSRVARFETGT